MVQEKEFVIDDDDKIYEISNLNSSDGVKKFMTENMMPITSQEINEQKNDIIESYYIGGKLKGKFDGYEYIFDYENDEQLSNLEWLEYRLNYDAIEINKNDEIYNRFYNEAKHYGYCG